MLSTEYVDQIANTIIEKLETFDGSWQKPFITHFASNAFTGVPYRGINQLLLNIYAQERGVKSSLFATFKQFKKHNMQIVKGAKGFPIIFWESKSYTEEVLNTETGDVEQVEKQGFVCRKYVVFSIEDTENYTSDVEEEFKSIRPDVKEFFENTGINIYWGALQPAYSPKNKVVLMPNQKDFISETEFVSTMAHEYSHAAQDALKMDMSGKFGDAQYALMELSADIGAGFVSSFLGYEYLMSNNNLAYLQSWLKALKNDKKAIFTACSYAQATTDYLMQFQHVTHSEIWEN